MQTPARLSAPAKLTRSLRVVGVRLDGYHLIESEMVSLDLADEIELWDGEGTEVADEVEWIGQPAVIAALGVGLVDRALAAVGVSVRAAVTKRIPAGAGLGGGSSDAAAVLRWAGRDDLDVAVSLGADVPFCVHGGRAMVRGIGEVVEPLPFVAHSLLLVAPQLHVSTPAVYAAWDAAGGPKGDNGNDLEPAALVVEPRLGQWRDLVASIAGRRPRLAGSGCTWWLEGERDELRDLQRRLSEAVISAGDSALIRVVDTVPGH